MSGAPARRFLVGLSLLVLGILVVACGNDATSRTERVLASAIESCSRVGSSGELTPCEDSAEVARAQCAALPDADRPRCEADLDGLLAAAQEAYHLGRGECQALTSEAARSACGPVAPAAEATARATPPPPPAPTASATASPGPALGPLAACAFGGSSRNDPGDACERALEDARDFCDRLPSKAERDRCKQTLEQLQQDAVANSRGRGNQADD